MKLHTPSRKGAVMSKYTPGPWKVDESEHQAMGGERIYKVITDRPMGGLVADVSAWWVDTESARHNAHLIAAAPAMYEALSDVPLPSCNGDKAEWYARFYVWYYGARQAAIAQAEERTI